jgi:hypothetical protein
MQMPILIRLNEDLTKLFSFHMIQGSREHHFHQNHSQRETQLVFLANFVMAQASLTY